MAARTFAPPRGFLARDVCVLTGKIDGNAGSALTQSTSNFLGGTITRTGTGTYLITLADKYAALLSANIQIQEDTPAGLYAEVGAVDVVSAKTIAFTVFDGAVPAAANVPATGEIHVTLFLSNTAQKPSRG